MRRERKTMLETIIVILVIGLDQFAKYIVTQNIYNSAAKFIPGVVGFRYCENTGAAFSMLDDSTLFLTIVSVIMFIALVYAMVMFRKYKAPWQINACLAMIAGGAVGNMIDRMFMGYVVDFIELEFMRFAIFNVADCFVCVGVALLLLYLAATKKGRGFLKEIDKPKAKEEKIK